VADEAFVTRIARKLGLAPWTLIAVTFRLTCFHWSSPNREMKFAEVNTPISDAPLRFWALLGKLLKVISCQLPKKAPAEAGA
jgi:hypothetical protein